MTIALIILSLVTGFIMVTVASSLHVTPRSQDQSVHCYAAVPDIRRLDAWILGHQRQIAVVNVVATLAAVYRIIN